MMTSAPARDSEAAWGQLMSDIGVPSALRDALEARGYTTVSVFAFAFPDSAALEGVLGEIFDTKEGDMHGTWGGT